MTKFKTAYNAFFSNTIFNFTSDKHMSQYLKYNNNPTFQFDKKIKAMTNITYRNKRYAYILTCKYPEYRKIKSIKHL